MALLFAIHAGLALAAGLEPNIYTALPTGSVTPRGWLLDQLTIQAQGLTGHLAQFWPDVQKSVWIGGGGDGGLHERTPYWLNGIVPLAYLLRNANVSLSPVAGVYKAASANSEVARNASLTRDPPIDCGHSLASRRLVERLVEEERDQTAAHGSDHHRHIHSALTSVDLLAQVECYIGYILDHQMADGWLGPDPGDDAGAPWGRAYVMLSLAMYAEATPSAFNRVSKAMLQYALKLKQRILAKPLASWAQQRWQEIALGVVWLLDQDAAGGQEAELVELLQLLHTQ